MYIQSEWREGMTLVYGRVQVIAWNEEILGRKSEKLENELMIE